MEEYNNMYIGQNIASYKVLTQHEKSRQNDVRSEAYFGKGGTQSTIGKHNTNSLRNFESPTTLDQTYIKRHLKPEPTSCTEIFLYTNDYNVSQMVMIFDDDDFTERDFRTNPQLSPQSQKLRFHKQFSSQTQFGRVDSFECQLPMKDQRVEDNQNYNTNDNNRQLAMTQPGTTKSRKHIGLIADNKSAGNLNIKLAQKNNLGLQKMGTQAKTIPKKNNFYSSNMSSVATAELSPIKSQTQNFHAEFKANTPAPNNLVYIPNSPYAKNMVMPAQQLQGVVQKQRVASAARAQSSQSQTGHKSKRSILPNGMNSQKRSIVNGFREIKSRASRFNLAQEEQGIYQNFAQILSSFDEETQKDLVECLMKDAREIQAQNHSQFL